MKKGNVKMLIRNLREMAEIKQCNIHSVVQAKPEKVCFRCGKPVKKKGTACYDCSLIDK